MSLLDELKNVLNESDFYKKDDEYFLSDDSEINLSFGKVLDGLDKEISEIKGMSDGEERTQMIEAVDAIIGAFKYDLNNRIEILEKLNGGPIN